MRFTGYLAVLTAALLWASSGTVGKHLFASGILPIELVQVRCLGASLLLALSFLTVGRAQLFYLKKRHIPTMAILGGVAMAMTQVTYFSAISKLNVAAAILLQYLSTVFIVLWAFLFRNERVSFLKVLAVFLSLSGCFLTVGGYDIALLKMNLAGTFYGLTSAVCFAAYTLIGERTLQRYSPWTVLFFALLFATMTCHLIHSPLHYVQAGYSVSQWLELAYVAAFGTALPFGLYFVGIQRIRASKAAVTSTLEPVFAGIIAYLFLRETFTGLQILGGGLILSAITLLQVSRERVIRFRNSVNRSRSRLFRL